MIRLKLHDAHAFDRYEKTPESITDGFKLGPIAIGLEEFIVGVCSNLITLPVAFLLIFLFKKSRRRVLRKSRIDNALQSQSNQHSDKAADETSDSESGSSDGDSEESSEEDEVVGTRPNSSTSAIEREEIRNSYHPIKFKRVTQFSIHWIFKYLSWLLCLACMAVSIFFLWAYAVQFGNARTYQWLTSMLVSFFIGIFLLEPLKVRSDCQTILTLSLMLCH